MKALYYILFLFLFIALVHVSAKDFTEEPDKTRKKRMKWWTEARFGMFIHWGLYSVPAGEWKDETGHAEWIRTTAQIPLKTYDQFVPQFNPTEFNAEEWVKTAKKAGVKYIVITTKHHDGFCLFDSKHTDFDIMSTPYKKDIMKELSQACHKEGIKLGWYYSIMDWHHPDYIPRREWEKNRPAAKADFRNYVDYMKNQLTELLTHYGEISVLWFDGEWEETWNNEFGKEIYNHVRSLQPEIIVNNRVGVGRAGMEGFSQGNDFSGDFGTPEQQIPATGIPGVDWETCMTLNNHWGYNKHDDHWKSEKDLVQKLADIASKGGNFLLNVGPTAKGIIPEESVTRLNAIGKWMEIYSESIYQTSASPFKNILWGRCTKKALPEGWRLYLHVFSPPADHVLKLSGIYNRPLSCLALDGSGEKIPYQRVEDAIHMDVAGLKINPYNTVIALDVKGPLDIADPPRLSAPHETFVEEMEITIHSDRKDVEIRYTLDGSKPGPSSPLYEKNVLIQETRTIKTRLFRDGKPVSPEATETFKKVQPLQPVDVEGPLLGIRYSYYEGEWNNLPDFSQLKATACGVDDSISVSPKINADKFGFVFEGYIKIDNPGVYTFYIDSDDGSRLFIGNRLVVENDGLHSKTLKQGEIALSVGFHPLKVEHFDKTGGDYLKVYIRGDTAQKRALTPKDLYFTN